MYNDQRIVFIKPMLPLYGSLYIYDLVDLNYMNPPFALMLSLFVLYICSPLHINLLKHTCDLFQATEIQ